MSSFSMGGWRLLRWPPLKYHKELLQYIHLNLQYFVFPLLHVCVLCDKFFSLRFPRHLVLSDSVLRNEVSGIPPKRKG